jgi:hypothetical protein
VELPPSPTPRLAVSADIPSSHPAVRGAGFLGTVLGLGVDGSRASARGGELGWWGTRRLIAGIRVDIIDGKVDVTKSNGITAADDLLNVDLNDERVSNQVDIIDGEVDVNEVNGIDASDDANIVRLLKTPVLIEQVDIIDGEVDVNEDGGVTGADNTTDVLLLFNNAAPIRVDIINGGVDVSENGVVNILDDLLNIDLNDDFVVNQVDLIDGLIDVNEDGVVTASDDATNIRLVRPN